MNKAVKIALIITLVILIVGALAMPVLAVNPSNTFDPDSAKANTSGVESLFDNIIRIVQVIGTGIAVIMLIVLAIKYLMAAPSEKADIKKGALVYVVAAVILFAAVNILSAIYDFSHDMDLSVSNPTGSYTTIVNG